MPRNRTVFFCTECGNETPKWQGRCPACGTWNTIAEQPATAARSSASKAAGGGSEAVKISDILAESEIRFETGLGELDRVLGGGAVKGSIVLIGGSPGIGKSTLLLQICGPLSETAKLLYVTGEESERQLKLRAERLGISGGQVYIQAETDLARILESANSLRPDIMIVDSIQTLCSAELDSTPGSVGQVKECTLSLMRLAKSGGITIFVIGHVNKEGAIAGPKVLEHIVDCVLYFEGDSSSSYRILRAAKNRFGSTNEIGVFEMLDTGLAEIANPSEMLLSGRPNNTPGTCVTCVMEGTRPILAEIQALVAQTSFNVPRRTSSGFDFNRALLLLAVLEKRGGVRVGNCDAYLNVIGGLTIDEPAADLAVVLAVASSSRDRPVPDDLAVVGEVGLTGELRSISNIAQRLSEIRRLGFSRCILPAQNAKKLAAPAGLALLSVRNVSEALKAAGL